MRIWFFIIVHKSSPIERIDCDRLKIKLIPGYRAKNLEEGDESPRGFVSYTLRSVHCALSVSGTGDQRCSGLLAEYRSVGPLHRTRKDLTERKGY